MTKGAPELEIYRNCAHKDSKGNIKISKKYRRILAFDKKGLSGLYIGSECYWTNRKGILRKTVCFDNAPDSFSEGLVRYQDAAGKMGFMNEQLKIVIPSRFDFVEPFKDDSAGYCEGCNKDVVAGEHRMITGGSWGRIDKNGKILPSPKDEGPGP
jgi:hypothetical protein